MRFRPSPTLVALVLMLGLLWLATGPRSAGAPDMAAAPTPSVTTTPVPAATTSSRATSPSPSRTTTSPSTTTTPRTCVEGIPTRLRIPSLRVDAPFEQIGIDRTAEPDAKGRYPLGNPKDRTKAGWYADGPRPGSGVGTILTNGHTYRDNSAIFTENFARRIARGQTIQITVDNGATCSYVVQRLWREVNAERDYPRIVTEEHLYDFGGPERLFLTTCGGSWNAVSQNYDEISLLIATPVD